ncbi:MAG: type II toxin-antitoxin system VapC family toxin [Nitrospira sp.]|nr:type II toxin-antitoxin system VapC family toxin [Nitrospira sp.]MDH4304280.1 type II toxin-antitoxin system VapC family toxin [Nitrospira sp.]
MIVIDTSAVVAILRDEAERRTFNEVIEGAKRCLMSAVSFVEASMVMESRMGYDGLRDFELFVLKAGIEIVPVDVEQANIARGAFRKFGKGRHAANLNFGDCFSYALAKATDAALLFKGHDFSRTDIEVAVKQ